MRMYTVCVVIYFYMRKYFDIFTSEIFPYQWPVGTQSLVYKYLLSVPMYDKMYVRKYEIVCIPWARKSVCSNLYQLYYVSIYGWLFNGGGGWPIKKIQSGGNSLMDVRGLSAVNYRPFWVKHAMTTFFYDPSSNDTVPLSPWDSLFWPVNFLPWWFFLWTWTKA